MTKVIKTTAKVWLGGKAIPMGRRLKVGEDLTEAQAREVCQLGGAIPDGEITPDETPVNPAPVGPTEAEVAALRTRVDEAIRTMKPEGFGKDGLPNLGAIRTALPKDRASIDKDLRDSVWAEMTEAGFVAPTAEPQGGADAT